MRLRHFVTLSLVALVMVGCARRQAVRVGPNRVATPVVVAAPVAVARPAVVARPVVVATPVAYAPVAEPPYQLDSGDRLRVVVFGQEGLTNAYTVDAGGGITMPLIGAVHARGMTTGELSQAVAVRLRRNFIREPHVAVEIESYRPFFILGEVANPGQYPYVAHMTAETAVAIAGGFTPRAYKGKVQISRPTAGHVTRGSVPLAYSLRPGDTVNVAERFF